MQKKLAGIVSLAIIVSLVAAGGAVAGQFKNLNNTAALAPNGLVRAVSSPQNTGTAIELEAYEFLTAPDAASWTCRILGNGAGVPLNMRLVGLNGSILASCTAPAGGVCNTPAQNLLPGHRYLCLVASDAGSPAAPLGAYTMAVQRGVSVPLTEAVTKAGVLVEP
jgi:hypothetical protein